MSVFDPHLEQARKRAASGDLPGALAAIDTALAAVRQAQLFRARLLLALGRPRDALDEVVRAGHPEMSVKALEFRLDLEEQLDQMSDAVKTLDRMLALSAGRAALLARRALCFKALGKFDRAVEDLDAAIDLRPLDGELHRLRGELTKARPGDGTLKKLDAVRRRMKPNGKSVVYLDFARAKAFEDVGDYDRAFAALTEANRAMRAHYPFDIATRLDHVRAAREAFAGVTPTRVRIDTPTDIAPIFVTGMPRSGTTLIEQILSAHSSVQGGGETALLRAAVYETLGDIDAPGRGAVDLSPPALSRLGEVYANRLRARYGHAPRYTDKSLQTLLFAGPALTAIPRAHIVVLRRDPRAMALSLYKQVFRPGKQLFSYDLDDIRQYQTSFDALLAFWSERLPQRFHIIDYEDVVADPDMAIPALLQKLDLPWEPACLRPEDNARAVQTLSAVAVRRPINRDALETWRRYAPMLGFNS